MTWGRRKDLKIINEQDLEQLQLKSRKKRPAKKQAIKFYKCGFGLLFEAALNLC